MQRRGLFGSESLFGCTSNRFAQHFEEVSPLSKGRVLVTGGAGFIGSHVVDELMARGFEPYAVDDCSTGRRDNLPPGVPLFETDLRDRQAVAAAFAAARPAYVCHCAAQISVSRSVREPVLDAEVNVIGWLHVLEQSAKLGVERVVLASSGGTLYGNVNVPAGEEYPSQPISPYGIAKLAAEHYLRFYAETHGLQGIALRYANVYGPRQNPEGEAGVVAIFSQKMLRSEPTVVFGDGLNIRDYVFVGDVARANGLAFEVPLKAKFTALNIGTGRGVDVNTLEKQIRDLVGAVRRRTGSATAPPPSRREPARPGEVRSSVLCADRAEVVLGWLPLVPLELGLEKTVQWFAERVLTPG